MHAQLFMKASLETVQSRTARIIYLSLSLSHALRSNRYVIIARVNVPSVCRDWVNSFRSLPFSSFFFLFLSLSLSLLLFPLTLFLFGILEKIRQNVGQTHARIRGEKISLVRLAAGRREDSEFHGKCMGRERGRGSGE